METNSQNIKLRSICESAEPLIKQETKSKPSENIQKKMLDSAKIGRFMKDLMTEYDKLRGRCPREVGASFWDVVVISAGDEEQRAWYEAQLSLKREAGELPLVTFLCIPDPPGPRIGSGGSTLHILRSLKTSYGASLDQLRVLLIHAGGYSKRLPSHSCSGKIFSPLPIAASDGSLYQMLDLKLAMYLPFLAMMEPGVFITASDDIEVFSMDTENLDTSLTAGETVTALAHPSSLFIGTTHGVYVMASENKAGVKTLQDVQPCLEVLQKLSVELMRERGAVIKSSDSEERVYSDSAFWLHSVTVSKLVKMAEEPGVLDTESCIYGDFLTCLGQRSDKYHVVKLYKELNNNKETEFDIRKKFNDRVGNTKFSVLSMHQSKFYHLGTTQEYIHGLTADTSLRLELNLSSVVASSIRQPGESSIEGIVLMSDLEQAIMVPHDAIIEYSIIKSKVCLGSRTILSNVEIADDLSIPAGFLYHTVAVKMEDDQRSFVTVAFSVEDNMKFSADIAIAGNLLFGGKSLEKLFQVRPEALNTQTVFGDRESVSLWNARIFTSHSSMSESFRQTVKLVSCLQSQATLALSNAERLFSMEDIVNYKDCQGILEFRKKLKLRISSS